jgi:D-methionine transport system substrate-binding protein
MALLTVICLASCQKGQDIRLPRLSDYESESAITVRRNLKVGVAPGPYGDMYMETVQSLLAAKGYNAELVYYTDFIRPNFALAEKETDLNIFQHYRYLNDFKTQNDLDVTAITEIPTVSMGIFSNRYGSLDALRNGITVSVPNDATNRSRALNVLDAANVIKLNPTADLARADIGDIISNPWGIRFMQMDAQSLVTSLDSVDMSVINGNYAIAGGLNPSEALYNEILAEGYINVIAVRTEDLDEQFVRDIIDAVRSEQYVTMVTNPNGTYAGFQRPRYFFGITGKKG